MITLCSAGALASSRSATRGYSQPAACVPRAFFGGSGLTAPISTISFSWNVFATADSPPAVARLLGANDSGIQQIQVSAKLMTASAGDASSPWSNFWTSLMLSDIRLWVPAQSLHAPAIACPLVIPIATPMPYDGGNSCVESTTAHYDEQHWRRTQSAIAIADEVSLRGLPERVVAEMLFGLQQQVAAGIQVEVSFFRRLGDHMRSQEVQSLDEAVMDGFPLEVRTLGRHFVTAARRLRSNPETERHSDVWDLVIFGFTGFLRFDAISQSWLRAAAKAHAYDNLPRRRGQGGKGLCQTRINILAMLSESLRLQRRDSGADLTALARSDITAFLNRVAFLRR